MYIKQKNLFLLASDKRDVSAVCLNYIKNNHLFKSIVISFIISIDPHMFTEERQGGS